MTEVRNCRNRLNVGVTHADNQLVIFLNGRIVYNKRTEGDPEFSDLIELTASLMPGRNSLILAGIDWGGRANYAGTINIDGDGLPFSYRRDGTAPSEGLSWHASFELNRS